MRSKLLTLKKIFLILSIVVGVGYMVFGAVTAAKADNGYTFAGTDVFTVDEEALEEDYSDNKVCDVEFFTADGKYSCIVSMSPEEFEELEAGTEVTGYIYKNAEGEALAFSFEPTAKDINKAARDKNAGENSMSFGIGMACLLVAAGLVVMVFFDKHFTAYEQIWFLSILILAAVFSLLFPEEEANGVNGLIIMALYLADTILNILCELLISKQSKWNFIVSVFVELTEIAICIVLAYRFATLATTLFFWLPCDIISFVNWHKHPDRVEEELTEVRTLKGWQEILIILGIVVWTVGVGYFLTTLDFGSDFFRGNRTLEVIVCYIDACASAVGIVNGIFILVRLREQWIAWYIEAILEAVINILSGQFVLLILKLGYLTNTTYGYIKWTKYIKKKEIEKAE